MKTQPRYKPGNRISGRYQVHKAPLGGMSEVYLCLDLKDEALNTFAKAARGGHAQGAHVAEAVRQMLG